jgi:hypothetical protein
MVLQITILHLRGDTCWCVKTVNPKGRVPRGCIDGGNWVGFRTFLPNRQSVQA